MVPPLADPPRRVVEEGMGVEVEAAGAVVGTEVVELAAGLQGASSPSKRTIRTFRSIMPRSIGSSIPRWTVSFSFS